MRFHAFTGLALALAPLSIADTPVSPADMIKPETANLNKEPVVLAPLPRDDSAHPAESDKPKKKKHHGHKGHKAEKTKKSPKPRPDGVTAPQPTNPTEKGPSCEMPKDDKPKDDKPKDDKPKDDKPKDDKPKDDKPKDDPPKDNTPKDDPPKDNTPKDDPPKDNTPKDDPPKDNTPKDSGVGGATKATGTVDVAVPDGEQFKGIATFYTDCNGDPEREKGCWQKGACSFVDLTLPSNIFGTACISDNMWDHAAHCGRCVNVNYSGKNYTLMITNRTNPPATHLDLTPNTYQKMTGDLKSGQVDITWSFIECPIQDEPLGVRLHVGASRYWFAVSIVDATYGTAKVDVSCDEGKNWISTTRGDVNMFTTKQVLPKDVAWVRVTSVENTQVIVKDVQLKSGSITKGSANF